MNVPAGVLQTFSTDGFGAGCFLLAEFDQQVSNEYGMVGANASELPTGAIMGKATTAGLASAVKSGGNTGNGVLTVDGTDPVLADGVVGVYQVRFITAAANSGTFRVFAPDGDVIGDGVVGTVWNKQIKFTIADGATDFIVGDGFDLTVAAGSGQYVPLDPAATDGSADFAAILWFRRPIAAGATKEVLTVRQALVNGNLCPFVNTLSGPQKAKVIAQMAQVGIIWRQS